MAYMEKLKVPFAPDPDYSQETKELLKKEMFFANALFIDENYQRGRKRAAKIADERSPRIQRRNRNLDDRKSQAGV